ncbi:MAG: sodium/proton-translocating pyrophosphatase, partial [Saprospiraceae bacterium]
KKSFEKGVEINGQMYYKGSDPHKAAVTGDTVGDPFKDTSGPSMNILIKLTCLVGLTLAPILGEHSNKSSKDGINFQIRENRFPPGMTVPPTIGQKPQQPGQLLQMPRPAGNGQTGTSTIQAPGTQTTVGSAGMTGSGAKPAPTPEQQRLMRDMKEQVVQQMKERQKKEGNKPANLQPKE